MLFFFVVLRRIFGWRSSYFSFNGIELPWNDLHSSTLRDYLDNLSGTCHFFKLFSEQLYNDYNLCELNPQKVASFIEKLKEMFVIPRQNKFHENTRCQLLEAFLRFLLQLLYHTADHPIADRIGSLEKELRCLLTILGDISWMLLDSHDHQPRQLQEIMADFEAVANQAGCLVHSLLFSTDPAFDVMIEGIDDVLNHIEILKASLESCVATPAFSTPWTSVINSFLILDSLVDDLEDLLKQEGDQIVDVKDLINLLHQELRLLQFSITDMKLPQPGEIGELKVPLMRIGDISHQAQYLVTAFLVKDAPIWYVIKRLTQLSNEIEGLRMELQVITKKYKFGGPTKYSRPLYDRSGEANGVITVGFEDKERDVLEQLVGGGTKRLQVISILGMPGLGKTTLANKLFTHPLVSYTFDKLSWCVISQIYERKSILAGILIHINNELDKDSILNMEEETILEHIYKTLKGRRYFVVIDDIWDSSVWYELQRCFPEDGNGSRILLTSRIKDVAPPNSIIHELPFLSNGQCWELLERKVFGRRTCPPELQLIGKKIAAECHGLPLTVVVIGGVLSTVDEEESAWEEVRGSFASYIHREDNPVMQILELSYTHLPYYLKPCFLSFGAYEEDTEILVAKLTRFWIEGGFVLGVKQRSREIVAEEYLMELIERNLVMVSKRSSDGRGVKACVIHDLLRDLCLKKRKEESFYHYRHTILERGHRVTAFGGSANLSLCQHVCTLYARTMTSSLYVRDMRSLRVLGSDMMGFAHLFGLEYLINLRYLVIGRLPTSIEKLLNLEYLVVEFEQYLPPAVVKMKKLRYFRAFEVEYSVDCTSICESNSLEYLSCITIKKLKDEELLKFSPHLRKLKCTYQVRLLESEKREYPHFDLCFLTQLDKLFLKLDLTYRFKLEEFGFPSNIRKLSLWWPNFPWEKMSIVGRLKNLEVLKLKWADYSKGGRWDTRDGEFQNLRFLKMENINLSEWNVASNEQFPKLRHLIITFCYSLQEIPSEIGEIATLELIEVKGRYMNSLVESAKRIKQEQLDNGNEELRVIISTE